MLVKWDHFPRVRGENKKCLSCHHPVKYQPILNHVGENGSFWMPFFRLGAEFVVDSLSRGKSLGCFCLEKKSSKKTS